MEESLHVNAVLKVREQALARATRSFKARGSRAVRCPHCLMAVPQCICAGRAAAACSRVACSSAFCFLLYGSEVFKPSNTGRLIADVVPDNHAFLWQRTVEDPALIRLLEDPRYAPIVVYPHAYAEPERRIFAPQVLAQVQSGRIPLFVMLDGTWREARKMFKSSYLAALPVLGIETDRPSRYLMRDATYQFQWSTAEIGVEVLKFAGDAFAAQRLDDYFSLFCRNYGAIRSQLGAKDRSGIARSFVVD
ncbi:Conserved hypothetical protein [gamma proteobacterium HdN1]|nr:Conserved hypothetical protein [gamma proteobacterium HdN1]